MDAICGSSGDVASTTSLGIWMPGSAEGGVSPALRFAPKKKGVDEAESIKPPATTDSEGNGTVWTMVASCVRKYAKNNCVGWRTLVKREMEGKFEKLTLENEFKWWSYEALGDRVAAVSAGLPVQKGDKVLIYAETSRDWMLTALACFRSGAIVTTAYATLGEEGVLTALTQTDAKLCVCDAKLLKILINAADKLPATLETVATIGDADATGLGRATSTLEEMDKAGRSCLKECAQVEPEELAVIMYTSGTTGTSKGVCISHKSIVSMTQSYMGANPQFNESDVYVAYLPLAHIMEMTIEMWLFAVGSSMGYGSPHTLTDTGVKLAKGSRGDAPVLQPTAMLFAPAVLDKVYAAVKRKVEGSAVKEFLFRTALAAGERRFHQGSYGCGPVWDAIIMKKIQALIGGRVRYMASGSAPLTPEVQIFIQSCFNTPLRQGYGCTETCGGSCIADVDDNTVAQVGSATPCTYLRLRDWEEGNYLFKDGRRGEVLLGGPSVCDGYFVDPKNPDPEIQKKNEEDFVVIEGIKYFCTGDIGQIDDRGRLKIIDRKKDLFKGSAGKFVSPCSFLHFFTGEYVALSKVEAALKLHKLVEFPFVYGRTGEANVVALISPQPPALVELAKAAGVSETDPVKLCKDPAVIKAASDALTKQCKQAGLVNFEMPKAYRLCMADDATPAWTPDNGFLTSTMKAKRPIIAKAFKDDLDAAYAA